MDDSLLALGFIWIAQHASASEAKRKCWYPLRTVSPARTRRPASPQPVRDRDEREHLDFMNQPAPDSKGFHGHQVLQHPRRRIRGGPAPGPVVDEQREGANQSLLRVDNQ